MMHTMSANPNRYDGVDDRYRFPGSVRFARVRKVLLLAPLVVFPLLTLLIWSCGLLAPSGADAMGARASSDGRLNSSLPAAVLPSDSDWTKLTYYLKADRDSRKRTEARKRDPFYGLRLVDTGFAGERSAKGAEPAVGMGGASAPGSGPVAGRQGRRHSGSSLRPVYSTYSAPHAASVSRSSPSLPDDAQVQEIYRKLGSLRQALNQGSVSSSASSSSPTSPSAFSYSPSVTSAAAPGTGGPGVPEHLAVSERSGVAVPGELHASASGQSPSPDPEMAQISEIMDKILAVQHPELITDSLRRVAEKRMVEAYAVTDVPPDPIGSMAAAEGPGAPGPLPAPDPTQAAETVLPVPTGNRHNLFYGVGAGSGSGHDLITPIALRAVVPETEVLNNGTRVKIRLSGDMYVKGIRVPRGTLLYGSSRFGTDRIMVNITSLVTGGAIIPVALSVYDLDGLEGIHIPETGARQSLKSSGAGAVESMGIATLDPSIGAQVADAGIQAARNLLGKKIRKVQVTLRAGYQLLLKDDSGR